MNTKQLLGNEKDTAQKHSTSQISHNIQELHFKTSSVLPAGDWNITEKCNVVNNLKTNLKQI